jgi:hypothetical protein
MQDGDEYSSIFTLVLEKFAWIEDCNVKKVKILKLISIFFSLLAKETPKKLKKVLCSTISYWENIIHLKQYCGQMEGNKGHGNIIDPFIIMQHGNFVVHSNLSDFLMPTWPVY